MSQNSRGLEPNPTHRRATNILPPTASSIEESSLQYDFTNFLTNSANSIWSTQPPGLPPQPSTTAANLLLSDMPPCNSTVDVNSENGQHVLDAHTLQAQWLSHIQQQQQQQQSSLSTAQPLTANLMPDFGHLHDPTSIGVANDFNMNVNSVNSPRVHQGTFPRDHDLVTNSYANVGSTDSELHRSVSDLGTRINNFNFSINDPLTTDHSVIPNSGGSIYSTLFSNSAFVPMTTGISSNLLTANILENTTKNTSNLPLSPNVLSLENTELLTPSREVSHSYFEDITSRAPGTPLSQTPPPKPEALIDVVVPPPNAISLATNFAGSKKLDSQQRQSNNNNNATGSGKNKKGKKNKANADAKITQGEKVKKANEKNAIKQEGTEDFSFYTSDQTFLLNKVGNLTSNIGHFIKSENQFCMNNEVKETTPPQTMPKKEFTTYVSNGHETARAKNPVTRTQSANANRNNAKANLGTKLSYSDVLSLKKGNDGSVTIDRNQNNSPVNYENPGTTSRSKQSEQNANQRGNFGSKNGKNGSGGNSKKNFSPPNSNSYSPSFPRHSQQSKPLFGSKVGLDEFTNPTPEELANFNKIFAGSSDSSNRRKASSESLFPKSSNEHSSWSKGDSLPNTPSHSNAKKVSPGISTLKRASDEKFSATRSTKRQSGSEDRDSRSDEWTSGDPDEECDSRDSDSDSSSPAVQVQPVSGSPVQQSTPQHTRNRVTNNVRSRPNKGNSKGSGKRQREQSSSSRERGGNHQLRHQTELVLNFLLTQILFCARWLYHLVSEVIEMSSALFLSCWIACMDSSKTMGYRLLSVAQFYWNKLSERFFKPFKRKKAESHYLLEHIQMPTTGEDAMKRLLACRGLDNYSILGVTPDATLEDIRRYYRRQAFLVHPDKNKKPGAEEAFKVLAHAFEEVGEKAKREEYDKRLRGEHQLGEAWDKLATLLRDLERKLEEAANMIRCTSCPNKHRRVKVPDRPVYAARYCSQCNIRHAAKEGDIWAESYFYGLRWQYFACMDGAIYDISEWAACQASNLASLKPNTHIVHYRIIAGKKKPKDQKHDLPTDPEIEEFFNQLYKFPKNFNSGGPSAGGGGVPHEGGGHPSGRRREKPNRRGKRQ